MPTVHREAGFRFFFFSNEGQEPPHVHVEYGDGIAKFWLRPVELAYSRGMKSKELRRAHQIVEEQAGAFVQAWSARRDE